MSENRRERTSRSEGGSDRFQVGVAILIAVVSVVSAGAIWRASMAEGSASEANRHGLVTTVKYEAAYATNVSTLYEEARYAAQHARYQSRVTTLQAQGHPASRTEAQWVHQIVVGLTSFTPLTTEGMDLDARLAELRAADADLRDLDPQQDFDTADQYYIEAQVLVGMVIIFAFALFFLTLAEINQHRIRVPLAIIGAAIFLVGLAGVFITEAYFVLSRLIAA